MTDDTQNLHKQPTGCINGMFRLFDHRHFRRNHTKQLLGVQHRLNFHKAESVPTENNVEAQNEKSPAGAKTPTPRKIVSERTSRIQDAVKNSMHRQGCGSPTKSCDNHEREVTVIKHVDSPRPLPQTNLEKMRRSAYEGSVRVRTWPKEGRDRAEDERLRLPRFSLDGKESEGSFMNTLKLKDFPRLSLDSKVSATRSNFLGQEPESRTPSSPSIVRKLMGLDSFPEPESSPRSKSVFPSKSFKKSAESKEVHVCFSTPTNDNPASIYDEIEKRISELELNRNGYDLRAIKQILGAIKKSREGLESQHDSGEFSVEKFCSLEETYQHVPIVETTSCPKTELTKVMSSTLVRTTEMPDMQRVRTRGPKCQREDQIYKRPAKGLTPRSNNAKKHGQTNEKKSMKKILELEQTFRPAQSLRMVNSILSEKGSRTVSPKLQLRAREEYHLTTPSSSQSGRARKHSSKNGKERCFQNKKQVTKTTDIHLNEEQLKELKREIRCPNCQDGVASLKSESNRNLGSRIEADVTNFFKFTNSREQGSMKTTDDRKPVAELTGNIMERPSPVSVLDSTLYNEGSPSPLKKMSTAFQVGSPITNEVEWQAEDLNQLSDCPRTDRGFKHNQESTNILYQNQEPQSLNIKPIEPAANDKEVVYKSLFASGVPKDSNIIMQTPDTLNSSCYMITPSLFNTKTEVPAEEANSEIAERHGWVKFNQKIKRRLAFDLLYEILVCKNTLGELPTVGRRRISPNELIKEENLEIDCPCRMPSCNLDDGDNGLIRLVISEIKYLSDDWTTYSGEVPSLLLDIERLIFKDLINEAVTDDVRVNDDLLKRRRQLLLAN